MQTVAADRAQIDYLGNELFFCDGNDQALLVDERDVKWIINHQLLRELLVHISNFVIFAADDLVVLVLKINPKIVRLS